MDVTFKKSIIHRNDSWVRLQRYQWTYLWNGFLPVSCCSLFSYQWLMKVERLLTQNFLALFHSVTRVIMVTCGWLFFCHWWLLWRKKRNQISYGQTLGPLQISLKHLNDFFKYRIVYHYNIVSKIQCFFLHFLTEIKIISKMELYGIIQKRSRCTFSCRWQSNKTSQIFTVHLFSALLLIYQIWLMICNSYL